MNNKVSHNQDKYQKLVPYHEFITESKLNILYFISYSNQ